MTAISEPTSTPQPKGIEDFFKTKREQIYTGSFLVGAAAGFYSCLAASSYRTAAIALPAFGGCALIANGCRQTAPKNRSYSWPRLALESLGVGALGFGTVYFGHSCVSSIGELSGYPGDILRKAAEEGNFEKVKQSLPKVVSNGAVSLALLEAVKENHPKIVKFILEERDVDSQWMSNLLLNTAIEARNLEMIKVLMGSKSALNAEAEDLGKSIGYALLKANVAKAKQSIDFALYGHYYPAAARIILEARKDAKVNAATLSSIKDADLLAIILQNKNNQFSPDSLKWALHEYAETCREENVRSILQADPSLDKTLAMSFANTNNCPEVIKILLEGKDIDSEEVGNTLVHASSVGHQEIVESILQSGISISPVHLGWGFYNTFCSGNLEIARLYLPWIDQVSDHWKGIALVNTIAKGHREVAHLLIKAFKSIDSGYKKDAMEIAKKMGDQETIDALSAIPLKSSYWPF